MIAPLAALGLLALPLQGAPAPLLRDPGFEVGAPGKPPAGWALTPLSAKAGYRATVSDLQPRSGRACLEIASSAFPPFGALGRVVQAVPAEAVRGKKVRFRAEVRAEAGGWSGATISVRVVRPNGRPGHFADLAERPVTSNRWARAEVVADVADDAERVEVGFALNGGGKAWFDDAALEAFGKAGEGNAPPRALAGRGRENLTALARLLGYVRHFHPSDECAAADWEAFAVEAVAVAEPARTPAELAERLAGLFAPYAPSLQVFPTDRPPAAVKLVAPAGEAARVVAWRHHGVGVRGGTPLYRSERVADRDLPGAA
jgi:hypothetical protein